MENLSLFIPKQSLFHHLNPTTKLCVIGTLIVISLFLFDPLINFSLLILVIFPLAFIAKLLHQLLYSTMKITIPFVLSIFLIQGLLWPNGTPLFTFYIFSLKKEGLWFAIEITGRISVIVSSFLLFAFTTRTDTLMASLIQMGLPTNIAYLLVSTIQILPRFKSKATSIVEAQTSRGLKIDGNLFQRAKAIPPLIFPLVLSSLSDVEERAMAIETRAFSHKGKKTSLNSIEDKYKYEFVMRYVLLLISFIACLIGIFTRMNIGIK